jgi:hypothetical protein
MLNRDGCIKEEDIKNLEKESNKLKLQYNTSILLLSQLKSTIDKIEKNQRTVLKVILSGLISLIIALIKLLFT